MADKRELILDVLMRDKTGPASKSSSGNLKDIGDAAEDAAKSTEQLGKQTDKTEEQVEGLGKTSRTTAQRVADLDGRIENVNHELREMAAAWSDANDQAERDEISAAIRRTQRELRQLEKSRKILGAGLLPEPAKLMPAIGKAGAEAGGTFLDGFSKTLDAAGPVKIGAIIGGVLAGLSFAPALGATVAAGILGGTAGFGIIGGLKIAGKDARVKTAAKNLGAEITDILGDTVGNFVPATLAGMDQIRDEVGQLSDELTSIFDQSARYIGPLVTGVGGMLEQILQGVDDAVRGAAPVIDVLERNLPELGSVIGDVLSGLSEHGPAAAVALEQVIHVIEGAAVTVGGIIETLSTVYAGLAASGVLGDEAREDWIRYSAAAAEAERSSDGLTGAQKGLGIETKTAAEAAEQQEKAIRDLNKALRAQVDPLFGLLDAQDQVTEAQGKYDKAVKEHGRNSKEAKAASRDLAGALLDVNDKASQVGATADGKLTPAMRRILEEGGATERQIKDIERELGRAKKQADAYDGIDAKAKFGADTANAVAKVGGLIAKIRQVRGKRVTISVGVGFTGAAAAINVGRLLAGRAEGGDVEAGTPYVVGEKRPEVFVPDVSGTIVPSVGQFMGAGARTGGSSIASAGRNGDGFVPIRGDAVWDALVQAIASRVSAKGGRAAQLGIRFI